MGAPAQQRVYEWETATIGDSAAPYTKEVTEEGVAEYCRAARYENPVYTGLAAAKEAGYPGSITPPAMLLALAPLNLEEVAAAAGCVLPVIVDSDSTPTLTGKLAIKFGGSMVALGDVITSTTSLENKFQDEMGRFITFRVVAQNQRGELVVNYRQTLPWPTAGR